jgi:hypothetical protein
MLSRYLENWPYKLLALAIAIVLRVYVGNTMNPRSSKPMTVPVIVQGVSDNFVVTNATPNVALQISGPPAIIDSLGPSDIEATVNVGRAHSGANGALPIAITIAPDLRSQVSVDSKTPNGAAVYLDTKSDITMKVRADFSRSAPVGYEYQLPTVSPALARVDGPESVLGTISRLVVFADVDSAMVTPTTIDDTDDIVAVDRNNTQVMGVTITPSQAHVTIPIRKVAAYKSLVISPQIVGSPKYPLRVSQVDVYPTNTVVSGAAPLLAQTSVVMTQPVDLSEQTDTFTQTVKLSLPDGLITQLASVVVTVHLTASQPASTVPTAEVSHQVPTGKIN